MAAFLKRLTLFGLIFLAFYIGVMFLLTNTCETPRIAGKVCTNILISPAPPAGNTLRRFREIDKFGALDMMFVGSSHCYRTFDPRRLTACGLESFNLGSTATSPVNTYYMLGPYLERHRPRLLVLEIYPEVLRLDGVESFVDYLWYRPINWSLVKTVWAVNTIRAWNAFLSRVMNFTEPGFASIKIDTVRAGGEYHGRGFMQRESGYRNDQPFVPAGKPVNPKQLKFLRKTIEMARQAGTTVVLATQPVPRRTLALIEDHDEITNQVHDLAAEMGVSYRDFNQHRELGDDQYYYDSNHLNRRGVQLFMTEFLAWLDEEELLHW